MKHLNKFIFLGLAILSPNLLAAQEVGRNTFYIGGGSQSESGEFANDDTPFSIGFMSQSATSQWVFGFDIAGEGTVLDSTYNQDEAPNLALSLNMLVGANIVNNANFKADAALLLGFKQATKDCPDSFLGFQCYADTAPSVEYEGNFGGVVTFSFNNFLVGARATQSSSQVLVGVRF